jgi:hypothetical protein
MTHLLYFNVHGDGYVKMYDLCVGSILHDMSINPNIHILCITNERDSIPIRAINEKHNILDRSNLYIIDISSSFEMYYGKLNIYSYPDIEKYEKILYSDIDIIYTRGGLNRVMGMITKLDILYITPEGYPDFTEPWFYHKDIYSEEETETIRKSDRNKPMNTGLFGWVNQPNTRIKGQLRQILDNVKSKHLHIVTDAAEQPYINHRFLVDQNISYCFSYAVTLQPKSIVKYLTREEIFPMVIHFTHDYKLEKMIACIEILKTLY